MKTELTYEELHSQLMYNPWTGIFYWKIINFRSTRKLGQECGCLDSNGYIKIGLKNKDYLAHRLAWLYVYGYFPETDIDHKDRIKHHNWISNLREATHQCNMRNTDNHKDNTSGVKGVSFCNRGKYWVANITIDKKRKNLGTYKDFDNAVCARLAGEQCVNWSGCDSNSPAYKYVKENIQCH